MEEGFFHTCLLNKRLNVSYIYKKLKTRLKFQNIPFNSQSIDGSKAALNSLLCDENHYY